MVRRSLSLYGFLFSCIVPPKAALNPWPAEPQFILFEINADPDQLASIAITEQNL